MYPEQEIDSIETIANIPHPSARYRDAQGERGAEPQRADAAAKRRDLITDETLPVEISHYNIQRVFDIMANVEGRDIGSVAGEIDGDRRKMKLPAGLFSSVGRPDQRDARLVRQHGRRHDSCRWC